MQEKTDWREFWTTQSSLRTLFWKFYERYRIGAYKVLLKNIGLEGKTIIELGGGSGYLLGMLSFWKGAKAKVIDSSAEAYEFYRKTGAKFGVAYSKKDIFKERKKYDVVMSDGLIEHFHKKERAKTIALHKKLMKRNGLCIIFVPKNTWLVRNVFALKNGYEKKFFPDELKGEAEKAGLKVIDSISDMHMTGILCRK